MGELLYCCILLTAVIAGHGGVATAFRDHDVLFIPAGKLCIELVVIQKFRGIHETTEFLELFLLNLLLNENHPLHNRTLHISCAFKIIEKPDIDTEKSEIDTEKPDIDAIKADIEKMFQPKTTSHILKLREAFPGQTIFGRSDVMEVIDIKPSRASELLKEMAEYGVIEPVSGHGKGKYRFR